MATRLITSNGLTRIALGTIEQKIPRREQESRLLLLVTLVPLQTQDPVAYTVAAGILAGIGHMDRTISRLNNGGIAKRASTGIIRFQALFPLPGFPFVRGKRSGQISPRLGGIIVNHQPTSILEDNHLKTGTRVLDIGVNRRAPCLTIVP